jgi:hypothetical protein
MESTHLEKLGLFVKTLNKTELISMRMEVCRYQLNHNYGIVRKRLYYKFKFNDDIVTKKVVFKIQSNIWDSICVYIKNNYENN